MNNYEILGLPNGANSSQVKKKYRELCMIHHPDKGGNPNSFIRIKDAYEALLRGEIGEMKQQSRPTTRQYQPTGAYRFEGIRKDQDGYLIRFYLRDIERVRIYGKKGFVVCSYGTIHIDGITNLVVNFEEAEEAEYVFKIVLVNGSKYAEMTYKVTPPFVPNWWQKILIKLKIKNYKK